MTKLSALKKEKASLEKMLKETTLKLLLIQEKQNIPKIKAKYQGKFFRKKTTYPNSFVKGGSWFEYIKIIKVMSLKCMEVYTFQTDYYGRGIIWKKLMSDEMKGYRQISEKSFRLALCRFENKHWI